MAWLGLVKRYLGWLGKPWRSEHSGETRDRGPKTHVIILDGTMSSLEPGQETHAGRTLRLLQETGPQVSVYYEAGVQWIDWRSTMDVVMGRGINRQIRRAYGYLASRYRPGDRVFLMGYSRGAFAVRSLAGVIDMVGLLRPEHATERNILTAWRHYERNPGGPHARDFFAAYCHAEVPIEMVGVWDTVKSLGLRLPILWQFWEERHAFHTHQLGLSIRNGFHALARDETREVFDPVLWTVPEGMPGRVEQMWFRGAHGDVGGQLGGFEAARPLANISLVWVLDRAEGCGLPLPEGWRDRFATDPEAPSVGTWRGWGKIFLLRRRRVVGADPTEQVHPAAGRPDTPLAGLDRGPGPVAPPAP